MLTSQKASHVKQAGFTLVELAIVMIIIGLLIGGVLKGQELINNAKVTATVAQVKGIDGAISTFYDMYKAIPGDMQTPTTRLPNCTTAPCNVAGSGDGRLANTPGATPAGTEGERFFVHMAAADLLTGVNPQLAASTAPGVTYPEAKIAGVLTAGYSAAPANLTSASFTGGAFTGHYLRLDTAPVAAATAGTLLTANQAARIDQKLDDGMPGAGSVRAIGAAATCVSAASAVGTYLEAVTTPSCSLYMRVQG